MHTKGNVVVTLEVQRRGLVMVERDLEEINGELIRPGDETFGEFVRDAAWYIAGRRRKRNLAASYWLAGRRVTAAEFSVLGFSVGAGKVVQLAAKRKASDTAKLTDSQFVLRSLCGGVGLQREQLGITPEETRNALNGIAHAPNWQCSRSDLLEALTSAP